MVGGGVQYPGDDVVDSGSSELSRVVELAELFGHPCGRIGERVVGEGDGAAFARRAGRVGAVLSEHCVDPSFVAGDAQLIASIVDCRADCFPLGVGGSVGAACVEVVQPSLEPSDGIVRGVLLDVGEAALLPPFRGRSEQSEGVEHGAHGRRWGCRPVGERWLSRYQYGDLFEFDDVGPVGDDPIAASVSGAGGGEELGLDFGRIPAAARESVDEGLLLRGERCA